MAAIPFAGAINVTVRKLPYSIPLTAQLGILWQRIGNQYSYGVTADAFATDQQESGGSPVRANALIRLGPAGKTTYTVNRTTYANAPLGAVYVDSGVSQTVFEEIWDIPPQNPGTTSVLQQSNNDFSSSTDTPVNVTAFNPFGGGYNPTQGFDYGYNPVCSGAAGTHGATVLENPCPASAPVIMVGDPSEVTSICPVSINGHLGFRIITSQPPGISANVYCVWDSVANTYTAWTQSFGGAGNVIGAPDLNPAIVDLTNDRTLVLQPGSGFSVYGVVETTGTETSTLLHSNASGTGYPMLDTDPNFLAGFPSGESAFYYIQLNQAGSAYDVYTGDLSFTGGWLVSANQTQGVNPLVSNGSPVFVLAEDLSSFSEVVFVPQDGTVLPNPSGGYGPDWNYGTWFQGAPLAVLGPVSAPVSLACNNPPSGIVDVSYSHTIGISGGTPPYTVTIPSGALPGGLSISNAGVISGIPNAVGLFGFTVQAVDSVGGYGAVTCSCQVSPGLGQVYILNPNKFTDDDYGQIDPYYTTAAFPDKDQEQQLQLSGGYKMMSWLRAMFYGVGYMELTLLVNYLNLAWPLAAQYIMSQMPLRAAPWGCGNATGDIVFVKFASAPNPAGTTAQPTTDNQFSLSRLSVWMRKNKRFPDPSAWP